MTGPLDAARSQVRRPDRFDDRLAGVRAKVGRATNQLEALHREVQAFRHSEAYLITGKFEPERSSYVFRLRILEEPPLLWGVVIGEITHNLRSALDQLVWQLIKTNNRRPRGNPTYPILKVPPDQGFVAFALGTAKCPGPLRGVSSEALALIERTQPYHGGSGRLLGTLNRFWNADKHRFLIPTVMAVTAAALNPDRYTANEDVGPVRSFRLGSFTSKYEAELVVVGLEPVGPNPKMEMQGDPPIDIAFSGGPGIVEALGEILYYIVADVLAPLEDLFSQEGVLPERGKGG